MPEDWFRSPEWTDDARADFEARLGRSRVWNRTQYLRIKGLALLKGGHVTAARELWERVLLDDHELADLQKTGALEHLADSYAEREPERAEHYYRRLLAEHPSGSGTSMTHQIKLAELLLDRDERGDVDEAGELLATWLGDDNPRFPSDLFRWNLAFIRVAEATRDRDMVRTSARAALELADRGPVFSRHPTVGVVHAERATLRRLRRLAR